MSARDRAVQWAVGELGRDVMMGYRGDLRFERTTRTLMPHGMGFNVWDCSGLMGGAVLAAGGRDMRGTHNAQLFHDEMRELGPDEQPLPGDGAFYGVGPSRVIHIGIVTAGGKCLSADGATWGITSLLQARAAQCRVRLHETVDFRHDQPWHVIRRNVFLDEIDGITR